jgi:alanine dehydrogenase
VSVQGIAGDTGSARVRWVIIRTVLLLSRRDVEDLLDLDELVDSVASALRALSNGTAAMPARTGVAAAAGGFLAVMPAFVPSMGALTTKLVTLFPGNAGTSLPTHQAVIVAFDASTGTVEAIMDGTEITAARTAAGSALATRLLAREDARVLAILGTGVTARSHLRAVTRVRAFREVRVAGRDRDRAAAVAAESSTYLTIPASAAASFEEALDGADVVCACTHSPTPLVTRPRLAVGAHVNSVGVHPDGGEIDAATVGDALVVVESRASALGSFPAGANELATAIGDGSLTPDRIVEIGELIEGTRPGRSGPDQITLYKSVGVAVEDAAAAALVLARARERGIGRLLDL